MIIQNTPPISPAAQPGGSVPVRSELRAAAAAPAASAPVQPSREELNTAVAAINRAMQQANRNLEFRVDSDTDRTVVRMVDTSTGELIRQFPSEATIAISRDIERFQQGLLLRQKA